MMAIRASRIHGRGGFAERDIPAGTRIVAYTGELIDKSESIERCRRGNVCIFYFDAERDLDGDVEENEARFLNHSCDPNCEARLIEGHIWIVAMRDIRAGDELTFDYGYDLEDYRNYPCHCGAPDCRGFIVSKEFSSPANGCQA
ncbi:MAG TPA: SET domain-containing protein-lysine N-methyltransferase [Candidatus Paceibacterota bacterium]|nr:SET domain-containing protein-lysine N-methyltransferase [Verrucomicrobiota bacterium]HRY51122.1 SET domain-containing protein-lysine N-methyltransferase [Candidatus Paceibacterota bacterium]